MTPINPDTHPTYLQRYMPTIRQEMRRAAEAIKTAETADELKPQLLALAEQLETLNSVVHALINHVVRSR